MRQEMAQLQLTPNETAGTAKGRRLPRVVRSLLKSPGVLPACLLLLAICIGGIFAGALAPYDPLAVTLENRLQPPMSPGHLLGTDALGRDLLTRVLYGARTSLVVGLSATLVAGLAGTALGLIAGYYRGWVDDLIMRLGDLQLGMPSFLLAIALMSTLGAGLWNVILALSVASWITYARVVRSQVLSLREREFVEAAKSMGASHRRIVWLHILPHCMAPLIVIGSFQIAQAILTESSLSFLGLGVSPETPTWGAILSEGRSYMRDAWWVTTFPGLVLMVSVLCINTFGDWLRDYLDPKLRRSG